MRVSWRKILWIYRSAAGGWYVSIFKRGFHIRVPGQGGLKP
jgi:hypothetical protein